MSNKFQNEDFKTLAELTSAGGSQVQLLNTTKMYSPKGTSVLETILRKNNFSATTDPLITSDSASNFEIGSAWVNTITDKIYFCMDNTVGAAVWKQSGSTGGGVADVDYFYVEQFETAVLGDFTQTGLVLESTTPVNGTISAKLIHQSAVNQSFKKIIAVPEKYRGLAMTIQLLSKSTATIGNLTIQFKDETNNLVIQSSDQIQADSSAKTFQFGFLIPSNCLSFSYTITALPEAGSPVSYIDDIVIKSYWVGTASQGMTTHSVPSIEQQSSGIVQTATFGSATITGVNTSTSGTGIYSYNSGTGIYTILKDCEVDLHFSAQSAGAAAVQPSISVDGNLVGIGSSAASASQRATASFSGKLITGQTFLFSNGTSNSTNAQWISVSATSLATKNIVLADLVPAKAMNGSASITVPKITTQSTFISQSASFGNATITGALTSSVGSGIISYNSGTGIYTVLKDCSIDIHASLQATGASATIPFIQVDSTIVGISSSPATALARATTSFSGKLIAGQTFLISNGTANTTNFQIISVSAEAVESETKTWSSTQTLVKEENDSCIRVSGSNGFGSVNTGVRRFLTTVESMGSAITLNDSPTLGSYFTTNIDGIFSFAFAEVSAANAASAYAVITTQPDIPGSSNGWLHYGSNIYNTANANSKYANASWTGYLAAGTNIYMGTPTPASNNGALVNAVATYQGKMKAIQTTSDQKISIPTHELSFTGSNLRGSTATAIVKFDTQSKLRGDAFTITNTLADGTFITMKKAGKLDISCSLFLTNAGFALYISKNQAVLTSLPTANEIIAQDTIYNSGASSASASGSVMVKVGDIIRISSTSTPTANSGNVLNLLFQEQEIAVSVSNTLPQFSEYDSVIKVDTANAFGSPDQYIRRFSVMRMNLGNDIAYTDSVANGANFTIMTDGLYAISYSDVMNAATTIGISKNASGANTLTSYSNENILAIATSSAAGNFGNASCQVELQAGDVIRPHTNGNTTHASASYATFTISKIGKPNVTGIDVTPFINIPQQDQYVVIGQGNNGTAVTANVTDVTFNTVTNDLGAWNGTQYTVQKSGTINISGSIRMTAALAGLAVVLFKNGVSVAKLSQDSGSNQISPFSYTGKVTAGEVYSFRSGQSGTLQTSTDDHYLNIVLTAESDNILSKTETFSTDTASLSYAPSSLYTLATLPSAPVGTIITGSAVATSNTVVPTTVAPTQTIQDMNTNGINLFTKTRAGASTPASPAWLAIQIGKGWNGCTITAYASTARDVTVGFDTSFQGTTVELGAVFPVIYNPTTGIIVFDLLRTSSSGNTTHSLAGSDGAIYNSCWVKITASKNPAMTGINTNLIYMEAAGNAGQVLTANVTNIPFILVSDTHGAWNGTQYTVPESGVFTISGATFGPANTGRISLYINGVVTIYVGDGVSDTTHRFQCTRRFTKGQVLSFRVDTGFTLSNAVQAHNLTITKVG